MKSHLPLPAILGGVLLAPMAWSQGTPPGMMPAVVARHDSGASTSSSAHGNTRPSPPALDVTGQSVPAIAASKVALSTLAWDGGRARAQDAKGRWRSLTLDRGLQQTAQQLLRSARPSRGAIVVIAASSGRLLALAEYPAAQTHAESLVWSAITPAASLFKLVTTAALIERAQLTPDHRVCSEGGMHRLDARHLEAPTGGPIVCSTFSEILAASRNAAYARLVHRHLAPDELANFADRFGFNAALPADVAAELGRFQPAAEPLKFARTATGFVGSSLSALGAAYLGYVIARGGIAAPLRLFEDALDPDGLGVVTTARGATPANAVEAADTPQERILMPSTAQRLRDMMERVIAHGTAADAFRDEAGRLLFPHVKVAGKTGTLGRDEHTASWFVGFAPSRAPQIVVTVLLDNGPVWQTTAKRVASSLLREYFEQSAPQVRK